MSGLPPAAVLIPADAFVTGPAGAGGGGPSGGGSGDAVGISGGIESDELVLDPTLPPAGMGTPMGLAFSGSAGAKSVNVCAAIDGSTQVQLQHFRIPDPASSRNPSGRRGAMRGARDLRSWAEVAG